MEFEFSGCLVKEKNNYKLTGGYLKARTSFKKRFFERIFRIQEVLRY
jgi:hypothetical protein